MLSGDCPTETLKFPVDDIMREAYALLDEAMRDISDDAFRAYGSSPLLFELFFNLAKVSLALQHRTVTHTSLVDSLARWQPGASVMRYLRATGHDVLLRGLGLAERFRERPPDPPRSRWIFLWGRPSQNRSLGMLRDECEARGDDVGDLAMTVRIGGRELRSSVIPAPWAARGHEVWDLRRIPITEALRRATSFARAIRVAARTGRQRLELDERAIVRTIFYDVVLGDALEHLLGRLRPEALVCSMVWGLAYQAAYRANVRCVEFLHGSVQEGLSQPPVPRPRELVGATPEDLSWLEERTRQRFVQLLPIDPATDVAGRLRAQRSSEHRPLRVAYFPTYTAGVFGGSDQTRAEEDAIVRRMASALPEIVWQIKPHPFDETALHRFSWAGRLDNVEVLEASRDALDLLPDIDAAVHCGTSLSRPMGQLGIPQLEIALEGRSLLTALPPLTTVISRSDEGLAVLRCLTRNSEAPVAVGLASLRDRILIRSDERTHG